MRNIPFSPSATAPDRSGSYGASLHDFYAAHALQGLLARSKTPIDFESPELAQERINVAIYAHQLAWQMRKFSPAFLRDQTFDDSYLSPTQIEELKRLGYETLEQAIDAVVRGELHDSPNGFFYDCPELDDTISALWEYMPMGLGEPQSNQSVPPFEQRLKEVQP